MASTGEVVGVVDEDPSRDDRLADADQSVANIVGRAFTQSVAVRVALVGLGMLVGLIGLVAWALETEYGSSGTNFAVEVIGDEAKVYDLADQAGTRELVFVGTEAEARDYTERVRTEGRNYLIPVLILAAGAGLVVGGVWPRSWRFARFRPGGMTPR